MMGKQFITLLFVSTLIYAGDANTTTKLHNPFPNATIVNHNVSAPAEDNDTKNWNTTNWKNYFVKQGMGNSAIGNTEAMMGGGREGQIASTANPNLLTTDAIKLDSNLSKNQAISNGFDSTTEQQLLSKVVSNPYASVVKTGDKIDCYITRDISFRWKCESSGVIYGGNMDENGKKAREQCDDNCYEQKSCINLNPDSSALSLVLVNKSCDFSKEDNCTVDENLSQDRIVKDLNITFGDFNTTDENISNDYLIDITLNKSKSKKRQIVKNLRRVLLNGNSFLLHVNDKGTSIAINLHKYQNNNQTKAKINRININYKKNDKYICNALQNIQNLNPGQYGYTCAAGNVETFTAGHSTYKICNDGTYGADNNDGTFSSKSSCLSACKIARTCVPAQTSFSTKDLESFREGCIQGQDNCDDTNNDCKVARLHGDIILDENVFDATYKKHTTIKSGVQMEGVARPRIDLRATEAFEKRSQEEWKDGAFKDMALNHKYNTTNISIGEESNASYSYRSGIIGAAIGVTGAVQRAYFWNLKPRTFDVYNGKTYYLYAVIKATLGYHDYNEKGVLVKKQKQIWYIKTSTYDNFKPIKIGLNTAHSYLDKNGNTVHAKVSASSLDNKTFNNNNWISLSTGQTAAYFKTIKFGDNSLPYWSFPIISNAGNLVYALPGIVRRVIRSNAAYDQKYYSGKFDGTGDGLLTFSITTYYSDTALTYAQLYQKIKDGEAKKIFKQGEETLYAKNVKSDALESNKNIKIFQYGPPSKTTVSTRIFPNKQDIGKKGFIYVFIQ